METMDGILTDAYQPIQIQNRLQGNYLYPENSAHMNKSIIVLLIMSCYNVAVESFDTLPLHHSLQVHHQFYSLHSW